MNRTSPQRSVQQPAASGSEGAEANRELLVAANSEALLDEQRQIALYHQQIREQYARAAGREMPPVCHTDMFVR